MVEQYSFKNKVSYMAFTWQTADTYITTPDVMVIVDLDNEEVRLEVNNQSLGEILRSILLSEQITVPSS